MPPPPWASLVSAWWEIAKHNKKPVIQPVHLSGGRGFLKESGFYFGNKHKFIQLMLMNKSGSEERNND